jgi:hypothetical protein
MASMTETINALSLVGLAYRCRQETARFWERLAYDPVFCFELFRRALGNPHDEDSKAAWDLIHFQYHRQVELWVRRHRLTSQLPQSTAELADLALEKMWVSFASAPDKLSRFPLADADKCLKALLRFLQMCVHSVVVDALEPQPDQELDDTTTNGDHAADPVVADEFWQAIYRRLQNDKERLVIDATYVYGLQPRQIYEQHQRLFEDVREIYRVKENVLARFKRDAGLLKLLED